MGLAFELILWTRVNQYIFLLFQIMQINSGEKRRKPVCKTSGQQLANMIGKFLMPKLQCIFVVTYGIVAAVFYFE